MSVMTLSSLHKTGEYVSADMFGTNAVFEHTEGGVPTVAYEQAADTLGVQNIRFGGGQADLDPNKANEAGELPVDGLNAINIVTMQDGALRSELVNFLDWCTDNNAAGNPTQATLIIPTKHLSVETYEAFAAEIEAFVSTVMQQYGDVIAAFQIGNEYWEMGETAYGVKASLGIEAVERGMIAAGLADADQPDLLVQMGTAGNEGSEFLATPGVSDFVIRNKAANNQIIDQLSEQARAAIDGVIEHYYYNESGYEFDDLDAGVKNIDKDYRIWADKFGNDLDLHITEWNVKTTALEQHGMVAGSSMVKQFENMIELGVDGAYVWALDYHSRTALTLDTDEGVRLDGQGRLTNSSQGAVFDLMSEALIGKELVSASFSNSVPGISVSSYASAQEMVFYISSRSLEKTTFTLDLGTKLPTGGPVTAVKVAMDATTSNGLQWEQGVAADSVLIDGQPYFYNEHDVDVILTDMVVTDASMIELELNPFEVVELTVTLGAAMDNSVEEEKDPSAPVTSDEHYFFGDDADDLFLLTDNVIYIDTGAGVDTVIVDTLRGETTITFDAFLNPVLSTPGYAPEVTLANVERIEFTDGMLALDYDGNSGQAYRLYQASFDRTPDMEGLAFWMEQLDSGAISLLDAAEFFLASAEFAIIYGENETLTDSQYIDLLYGNVLNRLPDDAGYDFWRGQAENDVSREQMLVAFSESEENKANVATMIDDGIWFS